MPRRLSKHLLFLNWDIHVNLFLFLNNLLTLLLSWLKGISLVLFLWYPESVLQALFLTLKSTPGRIVSQKINMENSKLEIQRNQCLVRVSTEQKAAGELVKQKSVYIKCEVEWVKLWAAFELSNKLCTSITALMWSFLFNFKCLCKSTESWVTDLLKLW